MTTGPAQNQVPSRRLKNNLWFAYIVFLLLWAGSAYYMLAGMIRDHKFFAMEMDGHPYISDFVNVYNSATLAAASQREKIDIYSPSLQAEYAKRLTAPVVAEQPFYLQYPPFLFSIVRPLAFFDMLGAWLVWCSSGIVLLLVSAFFLVNDGREKPGAGAALSTGLSAGSNGKFTLAFILIATIASFPTWFSVKLGQTSLLLVPGLVAFWLLLKNKKGFLAGLASGVVMVKLQYLPPVFLIGFILRQWSYLAGFCTIGVVLLILSLIILGPENVMRFPRALIEGESGHGVSGVSADEMQNLRGNLTLLLGNDNTFVHLASIAAFAVGLMLLVFVWWRLAKTYKKDEISARRFRILASISTLIMLVVSPHCHTQDYLALVIPCIWLWFEIDTERRTGNLSRSLIWLRGLILFFPILGWPFFIFRPFLQILKIQPFFLWAVAVIWMGFGLYGALPRGAEESEIREE